MKDNNQKVKGLKNDMLFAAIALIVVGALFVLFPEKSTDLICYTAGAVLCIWGVISVIVYFVSDCYAAFSSYNLVKGIALLAVGIVILANPSSLAGILTMVFGIVLIIDGALKLQYSVDLARIHSRGWWIVMAVSVLMITLGAVVVIDPFDSAYVLMMFAGVTMIADGVSDLAAVMYIWREIKRLQKDDIT